MKNRATIEYAVGALGVAALLVGVGLLIRSEGERTRQALREDQQTAWGKGHPVFIKVVGPSYSLAAGRC